MKNQPPKKIFLFEKIMALLATANLGLVVFNWSYIPGRNYYYRYLPGLTKIYDPIKGIEPHRFTQKYLETVDQLIETVTSEGINSAKAIALLKELRAQSTEMIKTNPFELADKTGILEQIKNKLRRHMGMESATQSFNKFWSVEYLSQAGFFKEINYFNRILRPYMELNFYRGYSEDGNFIDKFIIIDLPFVIIFLVEFIIRTYIISRRYRVKWTDAMLYRWYDIFLFVPLLRVFRVIPVIARLDQSELLTLERVRNLLHRNFITNFAKELTEIVVVQVISQIQGVIRRGEITNLLTRKEKRAYIDLNNINEVEEITKLVYQLVMFELLPKLRPDIEELMKHTIDSSLQELSPFQLQLIPGLKELSHQITKKVVSTTYDTLYTAISSMKSDPTRDLLIQKIIEKISEAIAQEVQSRQSIENLEGLLCDLLEEVKINYAQSLSDEDVAIILAQTEDRRQKTLKM